MDCRVLLCQVEVALGNLPANLELHLGKIRSAVKDGYDLILFPELSLTGYFLKDQTVDVGLPLDAPELETLKAESHAISIAFGFVERSRDGRYYNSVAFLEDGEVLHVHRKVHLVTYGMFEESRDLAAGNSFECFDSKHGRFGLMICEDMWHVAGSYLHFLNNADAILVHSAGPGRGVHGDEPRLESDAVWDVLLRSMAFLYRTWIVYVNRVGWEDGILFGGGSRVLDPFGETSAVIEDQEPAEAGARLTTEVLRRARIATPLRRDEKPWILAEGLAALRAKGELA